MDKCKAVEIATRMEIIIAILEDIESDDYILTRYVEATKDAAHNAYEQAGSYL